MLSDLEGYAAWERACLATFARADLRVLDAQAPPASGDFIEAVRMADLLLLHVVDTQALARHFAPAEGRVS